MPREYNVQSGPDDGLDMVNYDQEDLHDNDDDSDVDRDSRRHRDRAHSEASASQPLNHVRQSALSAQAAAAAAASSNNESSIDITGEGRDLQLYTLLLRTEQRAKELAKRERVLAERERSISAAASKRSRLSDGSSSSNARVDDIAGGDYGSDSGMGSIFELDSNGGGGSMENGRSSVGGNRGKNITLRQLAISKFDELGYVDIKVFARKNLTVRIPSALDEIKTSAAFIAAWASYNSELQKYLIGHNRTDDALMVTKYFGQLIRLLTDFPTQWATTVAMDGYIRSKEHLDGPIVWTVDADDDEISAFRADIRFGQQLSLRATPPSSNIQRSTYGSARRSGESNSGSSKPTKSIGVCYGFNGEAGLDKWTNANHCTSAQRGRECKFQHICMICAGKHAVYESHDCAAQPRARAPVAQRR